MIASKNIKLFLWLPLSLAVCFIALMFIPRSYFNPWEYLNVWTVIKGLSAGYFILSAFLYGLKKFSLATTLLIVSISIAAVGLCLNWLAFSSLHYMSNFNHLYSFFAIGAIVYFSGLGIVLTKPQTN